MKNIKLFSILALGVLVFILFGWYYINPTYRNVMSDYQATLIRTSDMKETDWYLAPYIQTQKDSTISINFTKLFTNSFDAHVMQNFISDVADEKQFLDWDLSKADQIYSLLYQPPFNTTYSDRNLRTVCLIGMKKYEEAYQFSSLYKNDERRYKYEMNRLSNQTYSSRQWAESDDAYVLNMKIRELTQTKTNAYVLYSISSVLAKHPFVLDSTMCLLSENSDMDSMVVQDWLINFSEVSNEYKFQIDEETKNAIYKAILRK